MLTGINQRNLDLLIKHLNAFENQHAVDELLVDINIINRHRIDAFFSEKYLEQNCTPEVFNKLKIKRKRRLASSFNKLNALKAIHQLFTEHQLDFLVLKGIPLNQLLFKNADRRISRDIDILVKPKAIKAIIARLKAEGWEMISPDFAIQEQQWQLFMKEFDQISFWHPTYKVAVEVHWKLFRNQSYFNIGDDVIWSNKESINVGNVNLYTVTPNIHAVYVSLHGGQHQWDSLIWIADMYMLHKRLTEEELRDSIHIAEQHNVLTAYLLGYYIASLVFKFELRSELQKRLTNEVEQLAQKSIAFLQRNTARNETSSNTLKKMLYSIRIQKSIKGKIHHLYNFPQYSLIHLNSKRKFLHWGLRPVIQLKERRRTKRKN